MENAIATKAIFRDKKRRVWELDFLRGIAVIAMCFDHLMFDFYAIQFWFSNWFKVDNAVIRELSAFAEAYWYSTFRFYAHFIFVFLFLFLVGTSCAFSRDNVRRGSALAVVSLAFTGVTLGLIPMGLMEQGVIFGILHCIALSILCAAAVDTASKRTCRCCSALLYAPSASGAGFGSSTITMTKFSMRRIFSTTYSAA